MSRVEIESEVTGNVWKIETKVGDHVEPEDVLLILESMKMEIPVEATCAGTIVELLVREEEAVKEDQVVVIIETDG
ncbi:MAG: acetyl-CoA carboxylase biotin carboxyl carrier protein subunit [Proteobacteria bacterium]|nr:acetyl-CoA carboxylase biotin carboxyl carrier protein subunit [Pseudomonadota bacterium]